MGALSFLEPWADVCCFEARGELSFLKRLVDDSSEGTSNVLMVTLQEDW